MSVIDVYSIMLTFVEDEKFTTAAVELLTAGQRDGLIEALARHPMGGDVIPGYGGCRKLRLAARGKGAQGGVRVIFFPRLHLGQILLLALCPKSKKSSLTSQEIKLLKQKVKS